jgi:hypothetical protein
MNNPGFSFRLPEEFRNIRRLFLIPSASILAVAYAYIRTRPENRHYFRNAPLVADCHSPFFISEDTLLVGPFLGGDGISYIIRLLLAQKKETSVYMLAYGGSVIQNASTPSQAFVHDIDRFYYEDSSSIVHEVASTTRKKTHSILSTPHPYNEHSNSISKAHADYGITLIDMEASFIKKTCNDISAAFYPTILIRDLWNLDNQTHQILKKPSRTFLEERIEHQLQSLQSP